jgi:hypothetical protein
MTTVFIIYILSLLFVKTYILLFNLVQFKPLKCKPAGLGSVARLLVFLMLLIAFASGLAFTEGYPNMTNGVALVYFKQPWCPGCEYLERVTFNDLKVQERLSGLLLYALDVSRSHAVVTAYADGSFVAAKESAVC